MKKKTFLVTLKSSFASLWNKIKNDKEKECRLFLILGQNPSKIFLLGFYSTSKNHGEFRL